MKFNKTLVLSIALSAFAVHAEKIAAGVFKTPFGGELLTTIDKPCDPASGNAIKPKEFIGILRFQLLGDSCAK